MAMTQAQGIVLMVEADPGDAPPPIDMSLMRAIMRHGPKVTIRPDGSRTYTYTVSQDVIADLQRRTLRDGPQPTSGGLAACLRALAAEAREISLGDAAQAIDLAIQLIDQGGFATPDGAASSVIHPSARH